MLNIVLNFWIFVFNWVILLFWFFMVFFNLVIFDFSGCFFNREICLFWVFCSFLIFWNVNFYLGLLFIFLVEKWLNKLKMKNMWVYVKIVISEFIVFFLKDNYWINNVSEICWLWICILILYLFIWLIRVIRCSLKNKDMMLD